MMSGLRMSGPRARTLRRRATGRDATESTEQHEFVVSRSSFLPVSRTAIGRLEAATRASMAHRNIEEDRSPAAWRLSDREPEKDSKRQLLVLQECGVNSKPQRLLVREFRQDLKGRVRQRWNKHPRALRVRRKFHGSQDQALIGSR
jgi:hypothetical protein